MGLQAVERSLETGDAATPPNVGVPAKALKPINSLEVPLSRRVFLFSFIFGSCCEDDLSMTTWTAMLVSYRLIVYPPLLFVDDNERT